ncbi:hypothetical protein BKE56_015520 [Rhodococcus sp. M8]|nr:hypothetical protein BKE56_015520 [Rhodococcus sp. M8]
MIPRLALGAPAAKLLRLTGARGQLLVVIKFFALIDRVQVSNLVVNYGGSWPAAIRASLAAVLRAARLRPRFRDFFGACCMGQLLFFKEGFNKGVQVELVSTVEALDPLVQSGQGLALMLIASLDVEIPSLFLGKWFALAAFLKDPEPCFEGPGSKQHFSFLGRGRGDWSGNEGSDQLIQRLALALVHSIRFGRGYVCALWRQRAGTSEGVLLIHSGQIRNGSNGGVRRSGLIGPISDPIECCVGDIYASLLGDLGQPPSGCVVVPSRRLL